jgi:hypothetical protein
MDEILVDTRKDLLNLRVNHLKKTADEGSLQKGR